MRTVDDRAEGRAAGRRDALGVDDAWYREEVFSSDQTPAARSRRTGVSESQGRSVVGNSPRSAKSASAQKQPMEGGGEAGGQLAASTAALNLAATPGVWEAGRATSTQPDAHQPAGVANRPRPVFQTPTNRAKKSQAESSSFTVGTTHAPQAAPPPRKAG